MKWQGDEESSGSGDAETFIPLAWMRSDVHTDVNPWAAIPSTEPPLHLFVGVDNTTSLLGFVIEQKIVTLSAVSCWINSDFPVWKTSDSL